ncbi:MAG: protein O-mannosyl-transferase family, partial [Chloroflexota bacterium]
MAVAERARRAPVEQATAADVATSPSARSLLPLAIALGLITALSRVPFRSRYLFSWDSANFALALDQYNVAFHQPQPPGYPLYVAAANVVRPLLGDANASYVALSIVASALAVTFLTLAAGRLYGRTTALLAAVLLATSSVFWSQGEVAYPYAFLACFTSLVAWLCALIRDGAPRAGTLIVLTGLVIGLAAGFRSELLPFLTPLWLYAALRRDGCWPDRLKAVAAGGAAMVVAVVAWYVPMVQLSGGWVAYRQATGSYYAYFIQTTSGASRLLLGVLENTRALVGFLYNGMGLALLPMLYFLGRFFAPQRVVRDRRVRFLLLWLLPPLLFYVTVHIGNPGYVLSFLPALCIYAA